MNKKLLLIILIAIVIRFIRLDSVPISPDWDEVAFGYNAYSVMKTGRDEFGVKFPLAFRSFGEYKPPLYAYALIPFIAAFGLSTFSLRALAATSGVAAVAGVWFLATELLKWLSWQKHDKEFVWLARWLPAASALLLAISPWHVHFSRVAFESILAVTLNIWAVWAFLKGFENARYWFLSSALLALSMYAYHSQRIFGPLLFFVLVIVFAGEIRKRILWKQAVVSVILGIVLIAPLAPVLLSNQSKERLYVTSPFMKPEKLLALSFTKLAQDQKTGNPWGKIFDNRRFFWAKTFLDGYLSAFSMKWLFIAGDKNSRHHAPDTGLLYVVEFPFLLYGLYKLFTRRSKAAALLIGWWIMAPVPAAPTNELPHAVRTMILLPVPQIIAAIGLIFAIKRLPGIYRGILAGVYALNVLYFLIMYFFVMNYATAPNWQYGYEQAVDYAQAHKNKYSKVVVSMELEQPHVFFLFYTNYDPAKYLKEGGTIIDPTTPVQNKFDKYEFRKINWKEEAVNGSTLYIGKSTDMPPGNLLRITYPNGKPAIEIADKRT